MMRSTNSEWLKWCSYNQSESASIIGLFCRSPFIKVKNGNIRVEPSKSKASTNKEADQKSSGRGFLLTL